MKFIRIFLTVFLLLAAAAPSFSQDTREQESRRSALEKEIAQLEQQIAENISRSSSALNDLTLIRKQVETRKALVAESERQIMMIDDSITLTTASIAGLQARIDTLTSYFGRLVRSAYKNRDARVWYVYILTSRNFGQATRRYSYLKNLSSTLNDEAAQVKEMRAGLELELTRLDSLKVQATQLRDAQQKELAGLRAEEKRSDDLVSQLKRYRTRYQRQLETKRKQVEDLNREIERIIAEYIAEQKAREEEQRKSNKGKLPWPADGPVLEKFGRHNHPVYTNIVMPFSNGISIGLAKGSAVRAVFDGEVKNVIAMPGYNMCVLVQHGSYFTFYCKLGQVSVKTGDKVSTGSIIGTVDTIDGQTQLHFQIWKEKSPQNPEIWLRSR